jgi:hypothetical protein
MSSLLGCLSIGVAMGLLCRIARLSPRDESVFFAGVVAACGAVLGGLAAVPLLGFAIGDGTHLGFAECVGSIVGSIVVTVLARALQTSGPVVRATPGTTDTEGSSMNKIPATTLRWASRLTVAALLAPALAADRPATEATNAQAIYLKERAACQDGTSQQERAACLKEASAALAEARRARLGNGEDARVLRGNAVQRCDAVRTEDRASCRRLALGEGTVSGSAAAGGVVKELVTLEPAASAPPR